MIVDTATLAAALGITPKSVRAAVKAERITCVGKPRTGKTGRPTMWFDLDTSMAAFAKDRQGCESTT